MNKYQEALDKIAKHTNNPRSMYFNLGANEPKKYLDILQQLVNKETPKKVLNKHKEYVFPRAYRFSGLCPNCKTHIDSGKYCPTCGQKLDWSECDA